MHACNMERVCVVCNTGPNLDCPTARFDRGAGRTLANKDIKKGSLSCPFFHFHLFFSPATLSFFPDRPKCTNNSACSTIIRPAHVSVADSVSFRFFFFSRVFSLYWGTQVYEGPMTILVAFPWRFSISSVQTNAHLPESGLVSTNSSQVLSLMTEQYLHRGLPLRGFLSGCCQRIRQYRECSVECGTDAATCSSGNAAVHSGPVALGYGGVFF
ncbi:hypothetical protein BKA64DRAFT_401167 [Cadophora sp. MPI-SDFR-AT-0126]|nr:hypothetical protein BKA64DRAFT_401167 [Leotiomycetes sp. MPI-SDFR-AT-0126]